MKIKEGYFLRSENNNKHTVVPLKPGKEGFKGIMSLNESGALLWKALEQGADYDALLQAMAEEYDVEGSEVEKDVKKFLKILKKIGVLVLVMTDQNDDVLEFPPLKIQISARKVHYKDEEIMLSNREFDILVLLAQNHGKLVTYEQIGTKINGDYMESDRKTLMVTISRLRKKLCLYDNKLGDMIGTVWGEGYKFR